MEDPLVNYALTTLVTLVISGLTFYLTLGKSIVSIKDLKETKERIYTYVDKQAHNDEKQLTAIKECLDSINTRLSRIEGRLETYKAEK